MSLLDDEEILYQNVEIQILTIVKKEELFVKGFLKQGGVKAVCSKAPLLTKKLNEAYHFNLESSFTSQLKHTIEAIINPDYQEQKTRPIYSVDCSKLCKGDAYSWLSKIAEVEEGAIVVVENVPRVPSGDPNIYDDPNYVTNLLLRSWKNEQIYVGDVVIDRRKLTVILTCPPEDSDILERECGLCSYGWIGDFEEYTKELCEIAESIVRQKLQDGKEI